MLVNHLSRKRRRRGVILLVVISLLTLFAVVGLSFVLYSEGSANSARVWREARQGRSVQLEIPPADDSIVNQIAGEFIFGIDASTTTPPGDPSKVRQMWYGHDLASAMYGWKEAQSTGFPNGQAPNTNINTVAYGGQGLVRTMPPLPGNPFPPHTLVRFAGNTQNRRPEFYIDAMTGQQFYVPKNADYTYPDEKDFYLAAIRASDGMVLTPSFHRDWLFDWGNATHTNAAATNPYRWRTLRPHPADDQITTNPNNKFPLPLPNRRSSDGVVESWGDVENIPNKAYASRFIGGKQYDSFWMDIDLPKGTLRGKTYKPIIAPIILDLDGRLNINVAGNVLRPGTQNHESHQGWGPWEMNLGRVINHNLPSPNNQLSLDPNGDQSSNLLRAGSQPSFYGRYGPNTGSPNTGYPLKPFEGRPGTSVNEIASGVGAPAYSNVNFDGSALSTVAPQNPLMMIPNHSSGAMIPSRFFNVPTYSSHYGNGGSVGLGYTERTSHPAFFNAYHFNSDPIIPTATNPNGTGNKTFGLDNFRFLNLKYDNDTRYAEAELYKVYPNLMPNALQVADPRNRNAKPRWLSTPISNDWDRIGYMPWQTDVSSDTFTVSVAPNQSLPQPRATANPTAPTAGPFTASGMSDVNVNGFSNAGTFQWTDSSGAMRPFRNAISTLDLSRSLADYRRDSNELYEAVLMDTFPNVTLANDPMMTNGPSRVFQAVQDRQLFARDLMDRLVLATVGMRLNDYRTARPAANNPGTPEYQVLQWLAQLAVNMVDYIDNDDYITPFNWNPSDPTGGIVYGTEMPRLVINEVYSRYKLDTADPLPPVNAMMPLGPKKASLPYHHQVFVEFINPLTITATTSNSYAASLRYDTKVSGRTMGYQVIVTNGDHSTNPPMGGYQGLRDSQNFLGSPDPAYMNTDVITQPLADPAQMAEQKIAPLDPANPLGTGPGEPMLNPPAANPTGFFLIGPENLAGYDDSMPAAGGNIEPTPTPYANMSRIVPLKFDVPIGQQPKAVTVFLQRLLCPHLPADPNPTIMGVPNPAYNPYITVDYSRIPQNAGGQVFTFDDRRNDENGVNAMRAKYSAQYSLGRDQPYDGEEFSGPTYRQQRQLSRDMTPPVAMENKKIHHTFFAQNQYDSGGGTPKEAGPNHWLIHLDRSVINQIELTHVSAYKPHELTHQFLRPTSPTNVTPYQHVAQWIDYTGGQTDAFRLSRFLGLVAPRPRTLGLANGGRVPGLINLNSQWDPEVLQAAFDPQTGINLFDSNHVQTRIFQQMISQRSPSGRPGPNDQPVLGSVAPNFNSTFSFSSGTGSASTLLRANLTNLDPSNLGTNYNPNLPHPYFVNEPLQKAMNRFTTRSNVFLMICTIGYFEVIGTDPTSGRDILGKEMGNDDGSTRRDKFMMIMDRSNLTIDGRDPRRLGPKPVTYSFEPITAIDSGMNNLTNLETINASVGNPITVTVRVPTAFGIQSGNLVGYYEGGMVTGANWYVVPSTGPGGGTIITLDTGDNAEEVQVQSVGHTPSNGSTDAGGGQITFQIRKPHSRGALLMFGAKFTQPNSTTPIGGVAVILGNPGPQPGPSAATNPFDYRKEPFNGIVPYVAKDLE